MLKRVRTIEQAANKAFNSSAPPVAAERSSDGRADQLSRCLKMHETKKIKLLSP